MKHIVTLEEFLERLKEKHGDSIEYVSGFKNMNTKCMFKCKIDGHTWFARPLDILRGRGCPKCARRKQAERQATPLEKMLKSLKETWGDLIEYVSGYVNFSKKCYWKCKFDNHIWAATPENVIRNKEGCPLCAKEKRRIGRLTPLEEIIEQVKIISEDTIEYVSGYINKNKKCKWKCKICGYEWETSPRSIINNGTRCPKCAIKRVSEKNKIPLEVILEQIKIKFNDEIEYVSDFVDIRTPCLWRCKKCGHEWKASPDNLLRIQKCCPCCVKKSIETPVMQALDKKNIKYKHNKWLRNCKPEWCRYPLKPDFYIETSKGILWIETDGQQHHIALHGEEVLKLQQKRDEFKNEYCKNNHICLIRVTSSSTNRFGTKNHITLQKLLELIEIGIDSKTKEIDFDLFWKYNFNRESEE